MFFKHKLAMRVRMHETKWVMKQKGTQNYFY